MFCSRLLVITLYYLQLIRALKLRENHQHNSEEGQLIVQDYSSISGSPSPGTQKHTYEEEIERLLIVDGHNDFPIWIRAFYHNHIYQKNFTETKELYGQVDFPRLAAGGLGAQFWSVYVECPSDWNRKNFSEDATYYENVHDTLQQIDLVHRLVERFPMHLQHARSSKDIQLQHQEYLKRRRSGENGRGSSTDKEPRRISSLLGIEGLHQIGNSVSILRQYYQLGVRYATLTHTCHNLYADSEEPHEAAHGGLSRKGVELIHEMNRLGMIVDLSHTSFATQRDVLALSHAPVMFSHSNAFSLCNHSRNVPDDVLMDLKQNGGVVMATFYQAFTRCDGKKATLGDVADHIEYIGGLIGYQYVGVGSDFDGMAAGPEGLEDVSKYKDLAALLMERGIDGEDLAGVMGRNVVRVLEDVEKVAQGLRRVDLPLEDDVKPFFSANGPIRRT